jgi:hypothetical protein
MSLSRKRRQQPYRDAGRRCARSREQVAQRENAACEPSLGAQSSRAWARDQHACLRGTEIPYKVYISLRKRDGKEIRWIGTSYADLPAFPDEPRRYAGFQLGKVQSGLDPDDWKPFDDAGAGTREIRIKDANGIYRVMYIANDDLRPANGPDLSGAVLLPSPRRVVTRLT